MSRRKETVDNRLIVSSSHLVSEQLAELSEFEFGLNIANNAFNRWMVHCMTASGYPDLGSLDILVLHHVNHRNRHKRIVGLCLVLNMEDTHTVAYSLKKLQKLELVKSIKVGKEKEFTTSEKGRKACDAYRETREQCLVSSFSVFNMKNQDLKDAASVLRAISGLYDQAARSAASL